MTITERQGIADAFRACLPYLWDGLSTAPQRPQKKCICQTLYASDHPNWLLAKKVIDERLEGNSTLWGWLIAQGICAEDLTDARVQAHRKAWVKQLIKEFSA